MLLSEVNKWHWLISWDNPLPADSSTMLAALAALGNLTGAQTKTTVILAPKKSVDWRQIRHAIESNLHPKKGNAVYANLKSGGIFHFGGNTNRKWKRVN